MKLLRYLGMILLLSPMAHAQYGRYQNCQLQNAMGQAVAGAQVYFLTQPANTSALTPKATIYSNATGAGGPISQPVFTDGLGQCTIYSTPGVYTVVYNSPLTGVLVYPDQLISTTGGAVFTPTGLQYATSSSTANVATIPQVQAAGGLGVHTNAFLEPNSSTFLYSPLSCANTTWPSAGCVDATTAIQAAQTAASQTGGYIYFDAAPPGYGVFISQLQAFTGEGGIVCGGRHYEQGCPLYQIPGSNKDLIVPNPALPAHGFLDYYLIDGMAFYGDFTFTSTTGNCITFGPLRVAERTQVNRTTCNNWANSGFNVNGGSDPLFFTDTESSGNGYGTGGGYGWNFVNTGGNTFDMVTLNGWSADNDFSGAINVQGTSNYFCTTCGDTFIFRSGKMESRYDNIHQPQGQPIGINLNTTSGTPIIIDGLSAIVVSPGNPGFPISTAVRSGSGNMVITTPTPHVPAPVGSNLLVASNSQSALNGVFPIVASTQTTTTVTASGGALTGTGGNIFFDVVTTGLVNITGNSANVKLNGVTAVGGTDSILGSQYGWYNIINDQVNSTTVNINAVPNHTSTLGASFVGGAYSFPNSCFDFQCTGVGNSVLLNPSGNQTVTQPSTSALLVSNLNTKQENRVVNASQFTGADIGAQINAAAATLSATEGGVVLVPQTPTCLVFTTPIVLAQGIKLQGQGKLGSCLMWNASGTAVTVTGQDAAMEDIFMVSQTNGTGTALNVQAPYFVATNLTIGNGGNGFNVGLTFGNQGFLDTFFEFRSSFNNTNILFPAGLTNAGEQINFHGGVLGNGGQTGGLNCVVIGTIGGNGSGVDFSFFGTSFDGCQLVNHEATVHLLGVHFEDVGHLTGNFVTTTSTNITGNANNEGTTIAGGKVFIDTTPPSANGIFEIDGSGSMNVTGLMLSTTTLPMFYMNTGSGGNPSLSFEDSTNALTGSSLVTIVSGTQPNLHLHTAALNLSTDVANSTFVQNKVGVAYNQAAIVLVKNNGINYYTWTGVGSNYAVARIQTVSGTNFPQVCTAPNFAYSGDPTSLGGETFTCQGIMSTAATATGGTCTPNGFITATIAGGNTIHIATCP